MTETLDIDFCRAQFPPLTESDPGVYFDNAGGAYVPHHVIDAMTDFMRDSQTQPEWPFPRAQRGHARIERARAGIADLFNIGTDEMVVGPSTTLNAYVLSHALRGGYLTDGDAIVVTNQDHEANSGCWRRLAETGIDVREWRIDPVSGDLDPAALTPLLADGKVKLVSFPHVSNVVGSVNDVKAITEIVHAAGAMVVVDGVAAVAHTLPDLKDLGVDFYMFSFYKLFGPHLAMLYARRDHLPLVKNQNHFFHEQNGIAKLNPGGTNYESAASIGGVLDYFNAVFDHHFDSGANAPRIRALKVYGLFKKQEEALSRHFLTWLDAHPEIRLIGRREFDPARRAATFSISVPGKDPMALAEALGAQEIGVGYGHFYGHRCVEALGIDPEVGVLRISMVHYSTTAEIDRLIAALEKLL